MNQNPERLCAITRKKYPRTEMIRLVRVAQNTKDNTVVFDKNHTTQGRGLHIVNDTKIIEKLFDEKKRKMIIHFLKTDISPQELEKIYREVLEFLEVGR